MELFEDDDLLKGIDLSMLTERKPFSNKLNGEGDPLNDFNSRIDDEEEIEDNADNPDTNPPLKEEGTEGAEANEIVDEDEDSQDANSPMKAFVGLVTKKLDIDYKEEEFEDTDEFLIGLLEKKAESLVKAKEDLMPEEVKTLWENYKEGVPIHEQLKAKETTFNYKSIEPEAIKDNIELQKALIKDKLVNTGMSEDKALKKIERYETTGVLEDEALESLEDLITISEENEKKVVAKFKEEKVKEAKRYDEWKGSLKESIDKKEEIIPGIKLDPTQKKVLFEGITSVDKNGKNAIEKFYEANPDFNLVVAYLATVLKGDFSVLQATASTKATKNLKEILETSSKNGGVTSASPRLKQADVSVMKGALGLNK